MPYTLAHVPYVLPLLQIKSIRLSATGLVLGTMLPDIEYYLWLTMYGSWGHTPIGIVYAIPLGVIIAMLFHLLVKPALLTVYHPILDEDLKEMAKIWSIIYLKSNSYTLVLSIILGILIHLGFDLFCHEPGYIFGIELDWLVIDVFSRPLYYWLQLGLSLIGVTVLMHLLMSKIRVNQFLGLLREDNQAKCFTIMFFLLAVIIVIVRFAFGIAEEKYWIHWMVILTGSAAYSLLLTCILFRFWIWRR